MAPSAGPPPSSSPDAGASSYHDATMTAPMAAVCVSPGVETTTLVESLYPVPSVSDIGSNKFCTAYCVHLERLSVQAHRTAARIGAGRRDVVPIGNGGGSGMGGIAVGEAATPGLGEALSALTGGLGGDEEYIVEAFLDRPERIEALIATLVAIELWRERVLFRHGGTGRAAGGGGDDEGGEVEFEIEGGARPAEEQEYDALNDVDGGEADGNGIEHRNHAQKGGGEGLAYKLAANGNVLRTAFVLHAETTIVSLLGLIFYQGIPAGLLEGNGGGTNGDEALLSLIDYCARQLIFLGTPEESNPALYRQKHPLSASQLSSHVQTRSRHDELRDARYDATYQTAVASVTLARYLCEHAEELGPSLLGRMMERHDFPLLMVPLVEEPPWTRRRTVERRRVVKKAKDGEDGTATTTVTTKTIWEKLDGNNEWAETPPSELLHLTTLEGQPWLALFHLTASTSCRAAYGLDEYRKSRLMQLRGFLHEALVDQLPVLGDVARYLDELSIVGVPPAGQGAHRPSSHASSSGLLLERVDTLRESIVDKRAMKDGRFWEGVADRQWEDFFSNVTDATDDVLRRIAAEVYGGAGMDDAAGTAVLGEGGVQSADESNSPRDEPQSTVEDWKVALSRPIEKVLLTLEEDGDARKTFELAPVQNGTAATTQTPLGPFRRVKLSIAQTAGEGDAVFPHARAIARIRFQSDADVSSVPEEVTLSIDSLALPTADHGSSQDGYDEVGIELPATFPWKEWRQLGDLEGRTGVLQLGFRRLPRGTVPAGSRMLRGYSLSQAFVSQPLAG